MSNWQNIVEMATPLIYNDKMKKNILNLIKNELAETGRPLKTRELSKKLGIDNEEYASFRRLVKEALSNGELIKSRGGRLGATSNRQQIKGKLMLAVMGHGFVAPDDHSSDIFISPRDLGGALPGEEVQVVLHNHRRGKNREGKIVRVFNREKGRVIGKLCRTRFGMYLEPKDGRIKSKIEVDDPKRLATNKELMVSVRLYPWETVYLPPKGELEEVLGVVGSPGIDIEALIATYGLTREFGPEIKLELAAVKPRIPKGEIKNREDFRGSIVFTIDPIDARDHDDAIGLVKLPNGNYNLGVHIADVSYYVRENAAIDTEAMRRGNSVYLVDRVIPMLPEKLSGDLCSLHDDKDRLTISFVAEIDLQGRIYNWRFVESIINSRASLTYEQVQDYFESGRHEIISEGMGAVLKDMLELSKNLRKKRIEKGSLDFDLPEPKVVLDSAGHVIDIFTRARMPSHQVVEEFMLLANRYAAKYLQAAGLPLLFRVHANPDNEKISNFEDLINDIGYNFSFKGSVTPKKIQRVLIAVRGRPEEQFVQEILLRSLAKAVYQPENIGHFGLAFDTYTHFTSPIRRYPDLLVHRLLRMKLRNEIDQDDLFRIKTDLKRIGDHCSATEIAADEAERDSMKIKQMEFLSERVGGLYDGVISGVIKAGIFVELMGSMVEGMVPFRSIDDDYYVSEEGRHRAVGKKSGRVLKLGDKVKVIVAKVDLDNKKADFVLVKEQVNSQKPPRKAKGKK